MNALETRKTIQGLLGVDQDGVLGVKCATAYSMLSAAPDESEWPPRANTAQETASGEVDSRSEGNIRTLHPKVQPLARQLVKDSLAAGIPIKITSGSRTYAEQNDLYEQGRSRPGNIVTNARGGYSNHNFGIAFDVTIFNGSQPVWDSPQYKTVGQLGKHLGLTWGGDWTSITDEPHFELHPSWSKEMSESGMLSQLRGRHETQQDVFEV